ncbi:hypothetical protein [Shewanella pneumatophori]|uniref:Uncharacterized protein n=1 Tax=Shewanella pneumatophori TaxID=314092 RepID=A0A9X2CFR7_9GAMM|nr:hypothetical protein [Shewanella pneumatophori]MCL1140207.1 hypothetical protein [Shewanella pneumatophori]
MTDKEHAAIEEEIKSLYQKGAKELPPASVDSKILAQAREQLAEENQSMSVTGRVNHQQSQSFWRQYRLPLSSAASVMVVVTLFMLNPTMDNNDGLQQGEPMLMSAPEQTESQPQMMRAMPDNAPAARSKVEGESFAQAPNKLSLAAELDKVEQLVAAKKIELAHTELQQISTQWPEVKDEQSDYHLRFMALQKEIMSGH